MPDKIVAALCPIVAFVSELVDQVVGDGTHGCWCPDCLTELVLDVRRSSEGDVFWRVVTAQVADRCLDELTGTSGTIERYDP